MSGRMGKERLRELVIGNGIGGRLTQEEAHELCVAVATAEAHNAALEARVRRLEEALGWAMGFVNKPTRRLKQNAAHFDAYERAVALLKEPTP